MRRDTRSSQSTDESFLSSRCVFVLSVDRIVLYGVGVWRQFSAHGCRYDRITAVRSYCRPVLFDQTSQLITSFMSGLTVVRFNTKTVCIDLRRQLDIE